MHRIAQWFRRGQILALATGLWSVAIRSNVQAQISTVRTWNVDADGTWTTTSNWDPAGSPSGHTVENVYGGIITADRTVSLSGTGTRSIGKIRFDNSAASYTLDFSAAGNALYIYNNGTLTSEMQAVEVVAGHHVINIGGNIYGPSLNSGTHSGGNKVYWVAADSSLTFQTTAYFHDHPSFANPRRPVIKEGPGVLVVDSGSSHVRVGTTIVTVSEGALRFTNGYYYPYTGSNQALTVGSGAVLAGQGEFGAQVRAATASRTFTLSGILDPGAGVDGSAPGTMSFFAGRGESAGQTLTTSFNIANLEEVRLTLGATSDRVEFRLGAGSLLSGAGNSAGVLTGRTSGTTTLTITPGLGFVAGTYNLISWDNGFTVNHVGTDDFQVDSSGLPGWVSGTSLNIYDDGIQTHLQLIVIPEPTTIGLLVGAVFLGAVRRRVQRAGGGAS